ncbi:MAG TPA: low temperature requirement protein A, partial [Pseudolysinimonas sp.]
MSEPGRVRDHATRLVRMTGRDPSESHPSATPLELLFDLAFVVAFAQAGDLLAHGIGDGHAAASVLGFVFGILTTCWAWVNYAWFASAYDTDDWFFRIVTMVQIVGVVVFALGMPAFGATIEAPYVDSSVAVAGYVVMRVAMVAHWLRAAVEDPERRRTALSYAFFVGTGQLAWVAIT